MARSSKSATKQRSSKSKKVKSAVNNSVNDKLKDELLSYYRDMVLIRRFEEKAGQLYGMGLIGASVIFTSVRKPLLLECRRPSIVNPLL